MNFNVKHDDQKSVLDKDGNPFVFSLINGMSYPPITTSAHLQEIKKMAVRDDDIWLASYPKTGTHWTWEIMNMIRQQKAEIEKDPMSQKLLEFPMGPNMMDIIAKLPSPRIIITHLAVEDMPEALFTSKAKIVYPYRNPKDSMVSMYNQASKLPEPMGYKGSWDAFLEMNLTEPMAQMYKGQLTHTHEWLDAARKMPDRVLSVEFEAMKKDPKAGVQKLADFLGFPMSPELLADITDKTDIAKLRAAKHEAHAEAAAVLGPSAHMFNNMFRKGLAGAWKNTFTVRQNEIMDAFLEKNPLTKSINFTYE